MLNVIVMQNAQSLRFQEYNLAKCANGPNGHKMLLCETRLVSVHHCPSGLGATFDTPITQSRSAIKEAGMLAEEVCTWTTVPANISP